MMYTFYLRRWYKQIYLVVLPIAAIMTKLLKCWVSKVKVLHIHIRDFTIDGDLSKILHVPFQKKSVFLMIHHAPCCLHISILRLPQVIVLLCMSVMKFFVAYYFCLMFNVRVWARIQSKLYLCEVYSQT